MLNSRLLVLVNLNTCVNVSKALSAAFFSPLLTNISKTSLSNLTLSSLSSHTVRPKRNKHKCMHVCGSLYGRLVTSILHFFTFESCLQMEHLHILCFTGPAISCYLEVITTDKQQMVHTLAA